MPTRASAASSSCWTSRMPSVRLVLGSARAAAATSARSRLSSAGSSSLAQPARRRGPRRARRSRGVALAVVLEVGLRALREREVLVALRRPSCAARRGPPRRRRSSGRLAASAGSADAPSAGRRGVRGDLLAGVGARARVHRTTGPRPRPRRRRRPPPAAPSAVGAPSPSAGRRRPAACCWARSYIALGDLVERGLQRLGLGLDLGRVLGRQRPRGRP